MTKLDPRLDWINRVGRSVDLATHTRHVAVMMAATVGWQKIGSVGIAQLAMLTGLSPRSVRRATRQLRGCGWLHEVKRGGRGHASTYRLEIPALIRRSEIPGLTSAWAPPPEVIDLRPALASVGVPYGESEATGGLRSAQLRPDLGPAAASDGVPHGESEATGDLRSAQLGPPVTPLLEGVREGGSSSLPLATTERARRAPANDTERAGLLMVIGALPVGLLGVNAADEEELRWAIVQRLRAGKTAQQLYERADEIPRSYVAEKSAAQLVRQALDGIWQSRQLPALRPVADLTAYDPPARQAIEWCGECDRESPGWINEGDLARKCPNCHPSYAATS